MLGRQNLSELNTHGHFLGVLSSLCLYDGHLLFEQNRQEERVAVEEAHRARDLRGMVEQLDSTHLVVDGRVEVHHVLIDPLVLALEFDVVGAEIGGLAHLANLSHRRLPQNLLHLQFFDGL